MMPSGGLVFIGATHDEKFRAIDKETGEILWEYDLPAFGEWNTRRIVFDGNHGEH